MKLCSIIFMVVAAAQIALSQETTLSPSEPILTEMSPQRFRTQDIEVRQTDETSRHAAYVGIFGGANLAQFYQAEVRGPGVANPRLLDSTGDSSFGGAAGVEIGYEYRFWDIGTNYAFLAGIELEGFWTGFEGEADGFIFGTPVTGTQDIDSAVFMLNATLKFECDWFRPYVGIGAGGAYVATSDSVLTVGNMTFSGDDDADEDLALAL